MQLRKIGGAIVSISLWLVTATVLLACVLFGRLFLAPIDVEFAKEQIIAQTDAILPGWTTRFSSATVGWDWRDVRPWVVIQDIQLIDRRNRLTATLPRAEIGLGFAGILSGLGVSTIKIDNAAIRVTDLGGFSDATDDSLFDDLFNESGIPKPEIFVPLTEAFNRFTLRLLDNAPTIRRIGFSRLSVDIYRGENLSETQIAVSTFDLRQTGADLTLAAQFEAAIGGNPVATKLAGRANPSRGDLSVLLAISDFYPSALPTEAGIPAAFEYLNLPINLNLELDLDASTGLQSARINAELGEGEIYDSDVFPKPARVTSGVVGATFDVSENILVVDNIDLNLEEQRIVGEGLIYWHRTSSTPGLQFELRTTDLPMSRALDYWPITRHPDGRERGARAWISQHMMAGQASDAVFRLDTAPSGVGAFADESDYQLAFDFEGLDSLFMQTMPPITDASGSALLTRTKLDIAVDSGWLVGMPITGSKIALSNIQVRDEGVGRFEIFARGDVKTVVGLVDNPPLLVAQKANLDIERLGGSAVVRAVVNAPLVKEAPPGSITYDVTAQITDARVADLLDGEGLSNAQLSLKVSQDALSAAGSGRLNGVPVNLRWEEDFEAGRRDSNAETTLLVLNGELDAVDLKLMGIDVLDFLHGKAQAEASFQGRNLQFTRGTFAADASTAALEIPQLAWSKPVGAPATINGGVVFTDQGSTLAPLLVQGEDIDLLASMEFGPKDSGIFSAELQARNIGRNQFMAQLNQGASGPLKVSATAKTFDLGAYLGQVSDNVIAAEHGLAPAEEPTSFDLNLSAEAILLENGELWNNAEVEMAFRDGEPEFLTINATAGDPASPVAISILNQPDAVTNRRPLKAVATDGGQVLRGLGLFAHVKGGALELDATTKGWDDNWLVEGRLDVKDSTLVPTGSLPGSVTEGTVSGLDDYLSDGDLKLDVLEVPFKYETQIVEFSGLKANGPTLGLTMEGEIATSQGLINVNGVVVPAYGINSLLGNIPLVGGLFSGGDGKGLFGVAYRVKGTTAEPDVKVNTLSGLAPGFLRLLFEGRKGRVADVEVPKGAARPEADEDPIAPTGDGG